MSRHRLPSPHTHKYILLAVVVCVLATAACNFPPPYPSSATSTVPASTLESPTPTAIPFTPHVSSSPLDTPAPSSTPALPFPDAGAIFEGVCFQYLRTIGGQTITLNSQADLNGFYNKVDESELCRDRVERKTFDFSTRQIIGTAITGEGCGIDLAYERTDQDDSRQQRTIILRATVSGDCPYELVRPVWMSIERPASGHTTQLQISRSP